MTFRHSRYVRPLRRATARARFERLEPRKLLSVTPADIAAALDLPDGTVVSYSGHADAAGVYENYTVHGILGMPSGPDGDFLVLSTGNPFDAVRTTDSASRDATTRYRDLGVAGASDDFATISFTLTVPASAYDQRLLIDFLYSSDENTDGGDFFDVIINGVNIAESDAGRIEAGGQYVTNERDPDLADDAPGYGIEIGTEYSDLLSISYTVPDGVTTLDITITIQDSNDAELDAWAMLDHVRFESTQVVFLDFDGQTLTDWFMTGMSYSLPSFDANDFGLGSDFADVITADLEAIFADFNIEFVTSEPTEGDFMRVIVGGANRDTVSIQSGNTTEWLTREIGTTPSFEEFFNYLNFRNANGSETSYGAADRVDLGNEVHDDIAVIFAEQISRDGFDYSDLINTMSHYIGRNLGLRAESNAFTNSIMAEDIALRGAMFEDDAHTLLGDGWGDIPAFGSQQNAYQILLDNLGSSSGDLGIRNAWTDARQLNQAHWTVARPTRNDLFDARFTIIGDKHTRAVTTSAATWTNELVLVTDYAGQDPQIVITAASRRGGFHDYETLGPRNLGQFTPVTDDARISLIGLWEFVGTGAFFQGSASLVQTDAADTTVYYTDFSFDDVDGDRVTIKLSSFSGLFTAEESDAGWVITLAETDGGRDSLTVSVSKKAGGDGEFTLGGLLGSGLKKLTLKNTHIGGLGADLASAATVKAENIVDGADFNVRTDDRTSASYDFDAISDGSNLVFGRETKKFNADSLTADGLVFDELKKLDVKEDITVDRFDALDASSATIKIKQNIVGGVWTFWNDLDDSEESLKKLDVKGDAGSGLVIDATGRIAQIKIKESLDADIDALAVTKLDVKGDWTGSLYMTHDGSRFGQTSKKIQAKGIVSDLLFQAHDRVDNIKLGAVRDSNFYIGFDSSVVSGLPVDLALVTNTDAKVKSVKLTGVRGETWDMEGTVFAAAEFNNLKLGMVNGDNGGVPFGIAAIEIDKIEFDTGSGKVKNKNDDSFNDNDTSDDFFLGRIV
ncbi:MAG: hypothetical protein ACF8PN_15795 [Phycisphaerales bacterium]